MKPSMRVRSASELSRATRDLEWWDGAVVGGLFGAATATALWFLLDYGTLWIAKILTHP